MSEKKYGFRDVLPKNTFQITFDFKILYFNVCVVFHYLTTYSFFNREYY